jgi:hypothetical protein
LVRAAHKRLETTFTEAIRLEDVNIIVGEGRSAGAIYSSILECAGEALRMRAARAKVKGLEFGFRGLGFTHHASAGEFVESAKRLNCSEMFLFPVPAHFGSMDRPDPTLRQQWPNHLHSSRPSRACKDRHKRRHRHRHPTRAINRDRGA